MNLWQLFVITLIASAALVTAGYAHGRINTLVEEVAHQSILIADLQAKLAAATPQQREVVATAASWREAMQAEPEGSPRYQAFEARLRRIGAI